jgi:TrpR family trp operon transcriptional repressor
MDNFQKGWDGFINLLLETKNKKTLASVLDLFLTHEEKCDLAMRFLIVAELLSEEKTQRQIAEDLKVSVAKITRGSNELKRNKLALLQFLKGKI